MICINQVLDNFLKQQGDWKHYLMANWTTIAGTISNHACIEKIENETLIIGVYDSIWLQELHLLSTILLKKINESLKQPFLKKIQFKYASRKKFIRKKDCTENFKPKSIRHVLTVQEQNALKKIHDHELGQAMEKFLMRCYEASRK